MRGAGSGRESTRSGPIAGLLFFSLLLAAILTFQAQVSVRYHRAAAEKLLRDYATLASDEFSRRTANEVGYSGFYPLITALRQAFPGALASPDALAAHADEAVRKARDLVDFTFRFDPGTARLETLGKEPGSAARAWLGGRLASRTGIPASERRYETLSGDVGGSLQFVVLSATDSRAGSPLVGFEVVAPALVPRFRRALARGPLLDTHIGELRRKLEDEPSAPRHIRTARKAGYRLEP